LLPPAGASSRRSVGVFEHLERLFGPLRRNGKGFQVRELFHPLFCFLVDGTSRHLVHFDAVKKEEGYAGAIETAPERMASSHQAKRLLYASGGAGSGCSAGC
jgi:hypothetical protein